MEKSVAFKFLIYTNESDALTDESIYMDLPYAVLEQWILLYLPSYISFSCSSLVLILFE